MSDPELAAGMQNPKVMAAFQSLVSEPGGVGGLMANPAKLQELMSDPEVGPFLQKLMSKLGPAMGGGGMPGMGGRAQPSNPDIDLSDLPDLE
jgi:suppressor of tumorigenicity protein 13